MEMSGDPGGYRTGRLGSKHRCARLPAHPAVPDKSTRAADVKARMHHVTGGGGLGLHVREFGDPEGPPILFLHGWSQMHLCWAKQCEGELARHFRLICPDLRGHGASEKPLAAEAYTDGALWAGDVAAVIRELGLERPLVVAWSMAGWVLGDYLRLYGDDAIGGVMLVGAIFRGGVHDDPAIAATIKPDATGAAMLSGDQAKALAGTVTFLKACFGGVVGKRDLALMAAWNALCPVEIRRACIQRDVDFTADYSALTCPVQIVHGKAERVVPEATADALAGLMPAAERLAYPGSGHMPFWEDAPRFDADLARLAQRAAEAA